MAIGLLEFRSAVDGLVQTAELMRNTTYFGFSALDIPRIDATPEQIKIFDEIEKDNETVLRLISALSSKVYIFSEFGDMDGLRELDEILSELQMKHHQMAFDSSIPRVLRGHEEFGQLCSDARSSIDQLIEFFEDLEEDLEPPTLPDTRPAPIQVVIENDTLILTNEQSRQGSIDYAGANRIRESLRSTLEDSIEDLKSSSNVDRNFIRQCSRLVARLSVPVESISIEDLGFHVQLVEESTERLSDEMGSTTYHELKHVLTALKVLLSQFSEWGSYLDELAKVQLDKSDGEGLVAKAAKLAEVLDEPGAPVQPAVVKRLRDMIEPAVSGLVNADTIAVPLVCSLSNIFSTLSQHAIDQFALIGAGGGIAAQYAAGNLLLEFAVTTVKNFCPLLCQYQPLKFILAVAEYLLKRYSVIKDLRPPAAL